MSPKFWESKAVQLHARRLWLVGGAVLGVLIFIGGPMLASGPVGSIISAIGFSSVAVFWALFCIAAWFEPTKGSLRPEGRLGRTSEGLNLAARWWASVVVSLTLVVVLFAAGYWVLNVLRAA